MLTIYILTSAVTESETDLADALNAGVAYTTHKLAKAAAEQHNRVRYDRLAEEGDADDEPYTSLTWEHQSIRQFVIEAEGVDHVYRVTELVVKQ